ncbi:hypothetical protein BJY01DRAFT_116318 [Aspergillus pseudoustus]|uniref:Uncharacterized protein n=1 Tax=Aspergillus pseudoustus TaxID=1810923 RepID=A0ABR4KZZ2_9EURO
MGQIPRERGCSLTCTFFCQNVKWLGPVVGRMSGHRLSIPFAYNIWQASRVFSSAGAGVLLFGHFDGRKLLHIRKHGRGICGNRLVSALEVHAPQMTCDGERAPQPSPERQPIANSSVTGRQLQVFPWAEVAASQRSVNRSSHRLHPVLPRILPA